MNKKVVVIGGGHGQSTILRGIKWIEGISISAIVTVADDGGSTGRLRHYFNIPAMGDIRGVLIALAESETMLGDLMDYRFENNEELEDQEDILGHNLGNLILTALTQKTGSFTEAIHILSQVLNVRGEIIPSSPDLLTLCCITEDGTIVKGEDNIPKYNNRIDHIFYEKKEVKATPRAKEAIEEADYIIYGIGSLYTSILPNIIIPDIKEALSKTKAHKIYICNAMTQPGETDGFSLEDHVQAINRHGGPVDEVVAFEESLPPTLVERYLKEGSTPVLETQETHPYKVNRQKILDFSNGYIRHDPKRIGSIVETIIQGER